MIKIAFYVFCGIAIHLCNSESTEGKDRSEKCRKKTNNKCQSKLGHSLEIRDKLLEAKLNPFRWECESAQAWNECESAEHDELNHKINFDILISIPTKLRSPVLLISFEDSRARLIEQNKQARMIQITDKLSSSGTESPLHLKSLHRVVR